MLPRKEVLNMGFFSKMFGSYSDRELKSIYPIVDKIEAMADEYKAMSDAELQAKTPEFKTRLQSGETLDDILPEAFATVREASRRVLGLYPYRVQLVGGVVLHQGRIAEMKTGEGEKVDVALVDSMVSSLEIINIIYLATGKIPQRIGNRYEALYPYDSFQAKDGMLVIGAGNDKLYGLLCDLMGKPELKTDPRFTSNNDRVLHHADLKPIIEDWLKDWTIDDAVQAMLDKGIPAAPINTIDRVVKDPHIAGAREMFVEVDHPKAGRMKLTGNQIKLTNHKIDTFTPAPLLGQHSKEVFMEKLGLTEEEAEALIASDAVNG